MAAPVTMASMRSQARDLAKMQGSTFVSDAHIDRLLLTGLARITDRLHSGGGQEYARSTVETNTVAGQALYDLPADFYRAQLVMLNRSAVMPVASNDWLDAASDRDGWRVLTSFQLPELAGLMNILSSTADQVRYRIRGVMGSNGAGGESGVIEAKRQIELRPTPRGVFTLRLDYLPTTPVPTGTVDAHTFDGLNGFEIIPILEAAIFMLGEEESSTTNLEKWLAREELRLDNVAPSQDAGRAERVVDVYAIDGVDQVGRRFWSPGGMGP